MCTPRFTHGIEGKFVVEIKIMGVYLPPRVLTKQVVCARDSREIFKLSLIVLFFFFAGVKMADKLTKCVIGFR